MAKEKKCDCESSVNTVLACAGASNVGQMSNELAKRLDEDGKAKYFCLAGVGGHVSGMVQSVLAADRVLVIDGCPVGCGRKCMDGAGLTGYSHMVLTELGVEKKHVFKWEKADFDAALDVCRKLLAEIPATEMGGYADSDDGLDVGDVGSDMGQ
jgi:uncharacterized metal-binding protein